MKRTACMDEGSGSNVLMGLPCGHWCLKCTLTQRRLAHYHDCMVRHKHMKTSKNLPQHTSWIFHVMPSSLSCIRV